MDRWKKQVRQLKAETLALYAAARHPQTPWYAKVFALMVAAYAFSPVDLIPDFIPVLGYLDDLVLVPLGVWIAVKMIPTEVLAECRAQAARDMNRDRPGSRLAAALIVGIWIMLAAAGVGWLVSMLN